MASFVIYIVLSLIVYSVNGTVSKEQDASEALTEGFLRLGSKFESFEVRCHSEIDKLRQETKNREAEFVLILNSLSKQVEILKEKNEALESENIRIQNVLNDGIRMESSLTGAKQHVQSGTVETSKHTGKVNSNSFKNGIASGNKFRQRKALVEGYNIAFTAYMDHDTDNLGLNQTLIFNQVLLNDGSAYNIHSGIFTAPMAGVYSFSFFVGERNTHEIRAGLWQNSINKLDAVSQTVHTTQDSQGGNTANLRLEKGDIVYVKYTGGSNHIEGSRSLRLTSFSGFILYPVEDVTILGK